MSERGRVFAQDDAPTDKALCSSCVVLAMPLQPLPRLSSGPGVNRGMINGKDCALSSEGWTSQVELVQAGLLPSRSGDPLDVRGDVDRAVDRHLEDGALRGRVGC